MQKVYAQEKDTRTMKFEPAEVPSTCICSNTAAGSACGCGNELPLVTAGCEIEGERRFSRLVEGVFEDKVSLI